MSKNIKFVFCELPETPRDFNIEKFKMGDPEQVKLYKDNKVPRRKKLLTYAEIDEDDELNYARVVPKDCVFIDYDDPEEAEEMYEIIVRSKLRCLILETTKGYHFLFRKPNFYKKEMTRATNWFGYKFDTKGPGSVQIIRVCGMDRDERASWEISELIRPKTLDIDTLDVLPYWLWGKLKDTDLHKKGKPGESEYTLTDTPFTQLMKMEEGGRHNHIVEKCSMFGLSNGFEISEFKDLITAIHDQYLVKLGDPMPDSDLFGDLEERWDGYDATLTSSGWSYDEKERKWKKVTSTKSVKIDEREAAEYLFKQYDFYADNAGADGVLKKILYRKLKGDYEYKTDLTVIRQTLKDHSDQNFKEKFFKEVEVQLMQMCAANNKRIKRSNTYVLAKNGVMSCIKAETYDFSWIGSRAPTDVVFRWTWQSEQWVEEHKDDLGGLITKFIKDLSRNSKGIQQPEVEQWLWVIAGASMIPANLLQKIVILAGGGQNGKSLYTSLIRLCLGENMFNTSPIFDSDPYNNKFWGEDLDKGICCIIDDLPINYNKNAFSYIKGAVSKSGPVAINEKFKPKREFNELPQIIICSNHKMKFNDKTEGMKRRVKILPTECHIDDKDKDLDLQHKLVLNTIDSAKVYEYKISEEASYKDGKQVMNLYTKEKCVLDSLRNGSLCWFANKCRYEYLKGLKVGFVFDESESMKSSLDDTFKNELEIECEKFIKWYIDSKCGTDTDRDLSKANNHLKKIYLEYDPYCETVGIENRLTDWELKRYCSPAITNLGYQITDKRDEKGQPYRYIVFGEEVASYKK